MGQGKIPRYSQRLMHWKRVTCELHDNYFRLMTIKPAIPKTAEVTHSYGRLWGDIEWAIKLLYNSVKTGSQTSLEIGKFGDQKFGDRRVRRRCGRESQQPAEGALGTPDWAVWRSESFETRLVWWQDAVEKASTQQKRPSGPPIEFGDQTSWWQDVVEKASTQQKAWPPGLQLSNPGERERLNADGHKSRGQYVAVLFGLELPLTHNPFK